MSSLERLLAGVLATILLAVLAAAGGEHLGAARVQANWDRAKLAQTEAQKRAILEAVAKNEADRQKDMTATRTVLAVQQRNLDEANKTITAERAARDRDRLRITIPRRNCPAAAGQAASTIIPDGAGDVEQIELPNTVERGIRDLAEDADREIARLLAKIAALQDWLKSHGFAEAEP